MWYCMEEIGVGSEIEDVWRQMIYEGDRFDVVTKDQESVSKKGATLKSRCSLIL